MSQKENRRDIWEYLEGRKGRKKCCKYIMNSKRICVLWLTLCSLQDSLRCLESYTWVDKLKPLRCSLLRCRIILISNCWLCPVLPVLFKTEVTEETGIVAANTLPIKHYLCFPLYTSSFPLYKKHTRVLIFIQEN